MVCFIGVDVGTGSARAGLVTETGLLLSSAQSPIRMWRIGIDIVEQSSDDIWSAVVQAVREVMTKSRMDPKEIAGVSFDATCSLVVVDAAGSPVTVSPTGDNDRNVIVWMDHRAIDQADRINRTKHLVLSYVGGSISPEMQTPKLLWLKENLPDTYNRAGHFFDLTDWLTYKATGSTDRSACTVTCKWTYLAHEKRWDPDYFKQVGLSDLASNDFQRIGRTVVAPGTPVGSGLTSEVAESLGLLPATAVGAGAIDAHAGGIGSLSVGAVAQSQMAYVFGTSACAMASTSSERSVPGVWGPYCGAMLPDLWLLEGGQSAAGAAIDYLVQCHPFFPTAQKMAKLEVLHLLAYLEQECEKRFPNADNIPTSIHVVPEFLGNRAPHADPHAKATITGLTLSDNLESLCELYLAGIGGIAYGARQIVDAMNAKGVGISQIVVSGGAGRSSLVRQILADATGLEVGIPMCREPVLLGAAILGAAASDKFDDVSSAMQAMTKMGEIKKPRQGRLRQLHDARYNVFLSLQEAERKARQIMEAVNIDLHSDATGQKAPRNVA
ncbi:FGGY-family carbohydrate kinase [Rhizobium sp. 2MFCol3.1]|uniref:FGGY-family carbohydrate kinase n=1 Tax=Rhizobium sp. 2MFCol3.1 TaxID=1246459 RepID=UPI00036D287B|nr:FGGY-family carbohydrate kinase [Rhizobium sp. 2MFCol3.1]